LNEYYIDPAGIKEFPFMNFVLETIQEKRKLLGAVTHIDGTARVQTVSLKTNPIYWKLIDEFRKITGIPILLNTSFNNHTEPIVDSVDDAVVCYLTTKLHYLVVGNFIIDRKNPGISGYMGMIPGIPLNKELCKIRRYFSFDQVRTSYEIKDNTDPEFVDNISEEAFEVLLYSDGKKTIGDLFHTIKLPQMKKWRILLMKFWICGAGV